MYQPDKDLAAIHKELKVICRDLYATMDGKQRIQLHCALARCIEKYMHWRERLLVQYRLATILLGGVDSDVDYSIRYEN